MDNYTPVTPPKKKYSLAIIAVIICAAIVAGAVVIAVLNPESVFDILPSLTGELRGNTHFSDIKYVRPDYEALINDFDKLINMIKSEESFTEQRSLYNKISIDHSNFSTMLNIAYIYYSLDTSDEFYSEELSILEKASVTLQNKANLLHDTIAASSFKTNYERSFYGVGYFTDWKNSSYSEEVEALMKKESELIDKYREIMSDPTVLLYGETYHFNNLPGDISDEFYQQILEEYYSKYNVLAGEVYVELVKTRLEIAENLGVTYAEYSYKRHGRDYSPTDGDNYLDMVSEILMPVFAEIDYDPSPFYEYVDGPVSFYAVADGVNNMNGIIEEAFDYMFDMGLYDIGYSVLKYQGAYTTFLSDYNAPYLFISPILSAEDFFSIAHELGHFIDAYKNLSLDIGVDAAEVASTAMEYILPYYTNALRGYTSEEMVKYALYSTTEMYTFQGYLASFESEVYSLSPEEVTLDKLNSIAYDCATKFGHSEDADSFKFFWSDIPHIYEDPFYVISYIISNDIALQVLEAEIKSPGKGGIDAFIRTIDRDKDLTFIEEVVDSGFTSPFDKTRVEKIAQIFKDMLIEDDTSNEETTTETSSAEAFANIAA